MKLKTSMMLPYILLGVAFIVLTIFTNSIESRTISEGLKTTEELSKITNNILELNDQYLSLMFEYIVTYDDNVKLNIDSIDIKLKESLSNLETLSDVHKVDISYLLNRLNLRKQFIDGLSDSKASDISILKVNLANALNFHNDINDEIYSIVEFERKIIEEENNRLLFNIDVSKRTTFILELGLISLSMIIGLFLSSSISGQIESISSSINRISRGDLKATIESSNNIDEIKSLKDSLSRILVSMKLAIADMQSTGNSDNKTDEEKSPKTITEN